MTLILFALFLDRSQTCYLKFNMCSCKDYQMFTVRKCHLVVVPSKQFKDFSIPVVFLSLEIDLMAVNKVVLQFYIMKVATWALRVLVCSKETFQYQATPCRKVHLLSASTFFWQCNHNSCSRFSRSLPERIVPYLELVNQMQTISQSCEWADIAQLVTKMHFKNLNLDLLPLMELKERYLELTAIASEGLIQD